LIGEMGYKLEAGQR